MRKTVIIHNKGIQNSMKNYHDGKCGSRMLFGIAELHNAYGAEVYNLNSILQTTWNILTKRCDIVFVQDFLPKFYLPFFLLKFLTLGRKKFLILMHAHPYGKGKVLSEVKWYKKFLLNIWCKGIDKALFFDPVSLEETVGSGALSLEHCQMVHWGEDLDYIKQLPPPVPGDYWVSSGKERRDFKLVNELKELLSEDKFKYIGPEYSHEECQILTLKSKGVIVTPKEDGLTYCCGITNIVEAIAMGKPVICVRNEHYPFDIEKEGCGFYVDCHDTQKILEIVDMIDKDDDLYNSLSQNAVRLSRQYNMNIFGEELINIVESL